MLVMRRRSAFSSCFDGDDDDGPLVRPCSTSSMMTPHDNVGLGRRWTLAGRRLEMRLWRWTTSSAYTLQARTSSSVMAHAVHCLG